MSRYEGLLRMRGEDGPGLPITIDLRDERLAIAAGDVEIGDWNRNDVRINADTDGIHIRAEGEEIVLEMEHDAEFAIEVGLKTAPPLLRRRMAQLLRD